ncbi:MAG: isoleucine--tRNA ligase [Candidatus Coatesbacteria bacterium]
MAGTADYRATLHLPHTGFPMKADLVKREPGMIEGWDRMQLYSAMRAARAGAQKFVLHDGPPFSNGHSHMGHLLNNVLKDAIVRYKFLRGFDVPFVPGWDNHGMAIENSYLKTSGIRPADVDPLELRRACAEYAMKWVKVQREQRKRTGALGDWERPYLTMDKSLEAAEIEAVGKLIRGGYIFRGKKPVYWCATCETALAENSVEYGPHVAPSVYVRFRVKEWPASFPAAARPAGAKPVSVVVWTTMPWTLPANVAVAFNPEFTYDLVETEDEILVMSHDLAAGALAVSGLKAVKSATSVPGRSLEGLVCDHPFINRTSVGVLADYVTLEAGSGVVHLAPGHGNEDYRTAVEYRLPILAPVDSRGRFTDEFPEFQGQKVFEANPGIITLLKERGALVHEGALEHSYPFCWRCKKPVIFRATEQWFISLEHAGLRTRAVEAARAVAWTPASGAVRMANMIDLRPDWCISRQRSWGVPIPVFYCCACGELLATDESLAAVRDWVAQEGADVWWIREADILLPAGTRCTACGGRSFRKEMDTLDPWFDSGCTHTSVVRANPDLHFPADLYIEATDQFRGWFQSSLLTSVALHGAAPFKAVVVHGWVLDPKGDKMSKSVGNVVSLEDAVNRWGADVMRVWGLSEHYHDDMRVEAEAMERMVEAYRKMRNTLRYLLSNLGDWTGEAPPETAFREVDRWMRVRLSNTVRETTGHMDRYAFHQAFGALYRFCVVDLSAFYLDLLKDRLYASAAGDPARRAAQAVLAETLSALVRMLTPFVPFTTEEAWTHLPVPLQAGAAAAQLTKWPEPAAVPGEAGIAARWESFMRLREHVLKALEAAKAAGAIAKPLESRVRLEVAGPWKDLVTSLEPGLAELLIVSQVEVADLAAGATPQVAGADGKLSVSVMKPEGAKCGRCWLVKPEVGTLVPADLCGRCESVIKGGAA